MRSLCFECSDGKYKSSARPGYLAEDLFPLPDSLSVDSFQTTGILWRISWSILSSETA